MYLRRIVLSGCVCRTAAGAVGYTFFNNAKIVKKY